MCALRERMFGAGFGSSSTVLANRGRGCEIATLILLVFFFFQAEDGIRDYKVTGVQTCALPICESPLERAGKTDGYRGFDFGMKSGGLRIDLNCDMGELPQAIADGTQDALMPSFTSINIACGGHAGDAQTMQTTIEQALRWNLSIGAHPGYPDRANFGRVELNLSPEAVADSVYQQVRALADIAERNGVSL